MRYIEVCVALWIVATQFGGPLLLLAGAWYSNVHLSIAGAAAWIVSGCWSVANAYATRKT